MSATETAQRPTDVAAAPTDRKDRRPLFFVLLAVLALALGALAGYALGSNRPSGERVGVAGGGELTDRQDEMVGMVDDYLAAMAVDDDAAILAMFQSNGEWTLFSETYLASDGTLEDYLRSNGARQIDVLEPMVIDDYRAVFFDSWQGRTNVNVIEFSQIGDVQIAKYHVGN